MQPKWEFPPRERFGRSGWQFNRIFRPPNRPPKDGRRPKDERLWVGDELGDDLGHDLGGQKILLNCHPGVHCTENQINVQYRIVTRCV